MKRNARLKALLFEKGITSVELAERISIPRAYLSLAMAGRFNFDVEEKKKIAATLQVPVDEVFEECEGVGDGL